MTSTFPEPPVEMVAALERAARYFPQRGITLFDRRGQRSERRSYPQFLESIRQAAGRWAALGVQPGDRIMVSLPTSWSWLEAWFGAMFCGALPVAVAQGAAMGAAEAHLRKMESLVESLTVRFALVSDGFRQAAEESGKQKILQVAITPQQLEKTATTRLAVASPQPQDLAFLQLTSGSTGLPRAVCISHQAAIHNVMGSDQAIGIPHGRPLHESADTVISWLPLHHDMGLVGCLLLAVYGGFDLVLLQPNTFLARPRKWLEQFGKRGVSFAPAPNFGYQLCVERLAAEARQGLDLSGCQDAMTGAEMIRPETIAAFLAAFEPYGFRREVFRPCYGLAEGTLAVTFDCAGRGARTRPLPPALEGSVDGMNLSEVVCVGQPIADTEVRVCGPDGLPLPEGEVGEIRVQGPSVFSGYYNDPEATAEGLKNGWLVTGDLGLIDGGELYITGRVKDLLIVRGHNLMPHEVEWLAESVTGGGGALRSGAFSIARGAAGEEAILVVEVEASAKEHLSSVGEEIRRRIGRTLSLPIADLIFVRRGKIPKTTSGKVQRRTLRDMYLRGDIQRI